MSRTARVERTTKESRVLVELDLDGTIAETAGDLVGTLNALLVRDGFDLIGEIQVADVPGRMEPGTGEIYYPRIAQELKALGYTGVVGLESFASGNSGDALEKFRELLTPQ